MDFALKLEDQYLLNCKLGNVMWLSPEGQLGKGIGRPSEVFSFALLVSQLLTWSGQSDSVGSETITLTKLLCAFGAPLGLRLVRWLLVNQLVNSRTLKP
jgi:hypothetical protein